MNRLPCHQCPKLPPLSYPYPYMLSSVQLFVTLFKLHWLKIPVMKGKRCENLPESSWKTLFLWDVSSCFYSLSWIFISKFCYSMWLWVQVEHTLIICLCHSIYVSDWQRQSPKRKLALRYAKSIWFIAFLQGNCFPYFPLIRSFKNYRV